MPHTLSPMGLPLRASSWLGRLLVPSRKKETNSRIGARAKTCKLRAQTVYARATRRELAHHGELWRTMANIANGSQARAKLAAHTEPSSAASPSTLCWPMVKRISLASIAANQGIMCELLLIIELRLSINIGQTVEVS